ncbi:MAG: NUDIX hydrolase [Alphaproteobacteria bacterium]|nr:NUDIX hydrolase [Alphaproteobacteria bacterium]
MLKIDNLLMDKLELYAKQFNVSIESLIAKALDKYTLYPTATNNYVVFFEGKFLLGKRSDDDSKLPGFWGFIGGRSEINETAFETMRREVFEEAGLQLTDDFGFLNSYKFNNGSSYWVCNTFLCKAAGDQVRLGKELSAFKWVESVADLDGLKCIDGVYNHLLDAINYIKSGRFLSIARANLLEKNFVNLKQEVNPEALKKYSV